MPPLEGDFLIQFWAYVVLNILKIPEKIPQATDLCKIRKENWGSQIMQMQAELLENFSTILGKLVLIILHNHLIDYMFSICL